MSELSADKSPEETSIPEDEPFDGEISDEKQEQFQHEINEVKSMDVLGFDNDNYRKLFCEVFHGDSGIKILRAIETDFLILNKIAKKCDLRVPLVVHYMKKIMRLGLVDKMEKPLRRKLSVHTYYRLKKRHHILFSLGKVNKKDIFKDGIKLLTIGLSGYLLSDHLYRKQSSTWGTMDNITSVINDPSFPFVFALGVIVGLSVPKLISYIKNKKR